VDFFLVSSHESWDCKLERPLLYNVGFHLSLCFGNQIIVFSEVCCGIYKVDMIRHWMNNQKASCTPFESIVNCNSRADLFPWKWPLSSKGYYVFIKIRNLKAVRFAQCYHLVNRVSYTLQVFVGSIQCRSAILACAWYQHQYQYCQAWPYQACMT
jgi:hypothetical protein